MQQYIIQPNDSLFMIAKDFKIPLAQLVRANPEVADPNLIYVGQIIEIPDLLPAPAQIEKIKANAEAVMDDVYAGDWQKAQTKVNLIKADMNELIPLLQDALVPKELIYGITLAIKNLEQNVMQKKIYPSISQANRITQFIPDLLDYFKVIIPTDVNRLNYLGRQMIVNVENADWVEANNNYLRAEKVWARLKPQLGTRYRQDIDEFEAILTKLGESINVQSYQDTIENANKMLDKLEQSEKEFIRQYM